MSERKRETPLKPVAITTEDCTPHLKQQIIAGLPFLQDLDDEELRVIGPKFRELGFGPGEMIDTGTTGGLFVVGAGLVKLQRSDYDGRDVVLDFLVTGEVFGPIVGYTAGDLATAHTAVCLFHVTAEQLNTLFNRRPSVASHVLEMTAARISLLHERLLLLSGATAKTRIVSTLIRLAQKVGIRSDEGILLQVPLSRENLAALCGTTTETTSRTVSALQRDGHLSTGRRWITLTDSFFDVFGLD